MWNDYVFHKQTIRELSIEYTLDRRIIKKHLESYVPPKKEHSPRPISLVVDATYFGERKEHTSWCVVVFRDEVTKENLWWKFCETETSSVYKEGREHLESLGYVIRSVTGDGLGAIRRAFSDIPFQMCHVHMERIVTRGTTRNPQTEAGEVLLAIVRTLHKTTALVFNKRMLQYVQKYQSFLNEKTIHPLSEDWSWTHERLRQAVNSLMKFQPYLFTYEKYRPYFYIPKTTNTLEGHFSHIKDILGVHRGLSRHHKERVLHSILLASTIAPDKKKLGEIL